ncbi:MAG TPA: hypothetical protein PKC76_13365 [Saprospiraceae bacterium]|nr:hypothetical protein [Saprospiraceae bacterium]HMP25122.1 hypothetical protein [Saprospiraceae bacterium]
MRFFGSCVRVLDGASWEVGFRLSKLCQSVKTGPFIKVDKGWDGNKKINGRKRIYKGTFEGYVIQELDIEVEIEARPETQKGFVPIKMALGSKTYFWLLQLLSSIK